MKEFVVRHDKGSMHVFAKDKIDAKEQFYVAIESIIGHQMRICGCYNNGVSKPIDRERVVRIIEIEEIRASNR